MKDFVINKITNQFPSFLNKTLDRILQLIYKWSRRYRWAILLAVVFAFQLMEFVFPSEGFKLKLPLLLVITTEIVYAIYLISLEFAFRKKIIDQKLICWYRIFVDTLCYSIFFWAIGGANSDAYLLYLVPVTTAITHLGIKVGFSVFLFIASLSLFITFAPVDIQLIAAQKGISLFAVISSKLISYSIGKVFFLFLVALVSVRAYIRELFYVKQLESLNHSAKIVHSSIDLEDVLKVIMKQGLDIIGSRNKSFFVQIVEGSNLRIAVAGGDYFDSTLIGKITSLDTGITGKVVRDRKSWISSNVATDPYYHEVLKETKSEIAVPVINERNSTNGTVIAVLNVESKDYNAFSKPHQRILKIFAEHAACSITAAQLYRQSEIEKSKLQNVLEISHKVQAASLERIDDVLRAILDGIIHLGYDRVRVYLISEDGTRLIPTLQVGFKMTEEEFQKLDFPISEDRYTLETSKGRPKLYKNKPYGEGLHYHSLEKEDLTEWAELPLMINEQFIGKITFDNRFSHKEIREEDLDHLMIYANYAAQAIQNSKKFQKQLISFQLQREEVRELKFLTNVATRLQQLKEFDDIVNTFLLAITIKDGLSFSRAAFLKIEDNYLIGWKAVGPLTQEEADELWPPISYLTFNDVMNSHLSPPNKSDQKIDKVIKSIRIKLRGDKTGSIANINNKSSLILSRDTIYDENRELLNKLNSDKMVFVPLISKNRSTGAIITDTQFTGKPLSAVRVSVLEIFSKYIAIAIENTQLLDSIKTEYERTAVLESILMKISSDENLDKNLKTILQTVIQNLNGDYGYIALLTKGSKYIIPQFLHGINKDNLPELEIGVTGITGWVYKNRIPYLWPGEDEAVNKLYVPNKNMDKKIETELIVPLLYSDQVVGMLAISSTKKDAFNLYDAIFVQTLASETAIMIQNKKFHQAALKLGEVRFDDMNEKRMCSVLAKNTSEIMETPVTCVWLRKFHNEREILTMEAWCGVTILDKSKFDMTKPQQGEFGGISWQTVINAEKNKTRDSESTSYSTVEDITNPKFGFLHPDFAKENKLESMISMPLVVGNEILGVINTYARRKYGFFDKEIHLLRNLATSGAIALKNAQLFLEIQRQREEAQQTNDYLEIIFDYLDDHRKLALIGLVYGESIHFANAKLGMAKVLADDIIQGYHGNKLSNLKPQIREIKNHVNSYLQKLKEIQNEALESPRPVPVYLHKALDRLIASKRISKSIEVKQDYNKAIKIVYAPRSQLLQVFFVIVQNALDAMREKGGILQIRTNIVIAENDKLIKVSISDTGIGIPEEKLKDLFEIRRTTDLRRHRRGSGLGLVWARSFIRSYEGDIVVESSLGVGTTIHVLFPQDFRKLKSLHH